MDETFTPSDPDNLSTIREWATYESFLREFFSDYPYFNRFNIHLYISNHSEKPIFSTQPLNGNGQDTYHALAFSELAGKDQGFFLRANEEDTIRAGDITSIYAIRFSVGEDFATIIFFDSSPPEHPFLTNEQSIAKRKADILTRFTVLSCLLNFRAQGHEIQPYIKELYRLSTEIANSYVNGHTPTIE